MSLLTVRQVAERVGLSEWAVRRAIHDGELLAYKPRGQLRIDPGALEEWLDSTRVAARPQQHSPIVVASTPPSPNSGSFRDWVRRRETA